MTVDILDIRAVKSPTQLTSVPNLRSLLIQGLLNESGNRSISSEVLYDTAGLQLYNHGIKNDWPVAGYYPIVAEKEILQLYGHDVASELTRDKKGRAIIVELGAGSLEKTAQILSSLAKTVQPEEIPPITYYALDIDETSLSEAIAHLQSQIGHELRHKIETKGLWGTYEDAFRLLSNPSEIISTLNASTESPVHLMFLGGTIGNFSKCSEDISFLRNIGLDNDRGDRWILGIDRAKEKGVLEQAYSDHLKPWMMNGLVTSGRILGDEELFEEGKWERWSRYNEQKGRIELGYKSTVAHKIHIPNTSLDVEFGKDEVIMVMFSNKYTDEEIQEILKRAGMGVSKKWVDRQERYYLLSLCASS